MKISEILKEDNGQQYAFHVTPAKNVKWIMQDGLEPSIGTASASYGEDEERLYLFPTRTDAEDAVMNWLGDQYESDILALLQVDITGIPVKKDVDWEYYTDSPIPPDRIKVLSMDI